MRLPAAYLLFIIPLASYMDFFTIHLRIFASSLSVALLNGFGLQVIQSGTALISLLPGAEVQRGLWLTLQRHPIVVCDGWR
jgi:hypothetical protein